MRRLTRLSGGTDLLVVFGVIMVLPGAPAIEVAIDNGLAPPNPANIIDDESYSGYEVLWVRNTGCGTPFPWRTCPGHL